ncbi:tRNA 2-thiouridine(34) synthase MnmA [Candidatus Gracilibacteria bacterium]|nr:tRNA 2-thiouridine(34) synthase MnmA [Candidatus Gracilibacteria bacterium]
MNSQPTVFVMLSGGVDSSVAAATLLEKGYNVVGVFIKCWSIDQLESMSLSQDIYGCFWEEDSKDAALVASKLGIPFFVWDFQKEYKQGVVDYMINEYKIGLTPNPDVMCNSIIKFGMFYQRAIDLGADLVSTGHYARVYQHPLTILRAKDSNKDQSYFLNRVPKEFLNQTIFPIGEYQSKKDVRQKAQEYNLITANKKDSQGLCFIGHTPMKKLLIQVLGVHEGNIVDIQNNQILGKHSGAFQYTIGQRHQLGLSGGPWFVTSIDIDNNIVYIAHQNNISSNLYSNSLVAHNPNWFVETNNKSTIQCQAQVRYRQEPVNCVVCFENKQLKVNFDEPIRAVAKGQSIVFTIKSKCLVVL